METKKELIVYCVMFKMEGHETWRAMVVNRLVDFDNYQKKGDVPKVTQTKILKINRITGEVMIKNGK